MKSRSEGLKQTLQDTKNNLTELLYQLPNIPNESVPPGASEEENEVYQDWETPLPNLAEGALSHWELAEKYNIIDFALGVKITGAGFPLFRGKLWGLIILVHDDCFPVVTTQTRKDS